jgi:hypothetical protein
VGTKSCSKKVRTWVIKGTAPSGAMDENGVCFIIKRKSFHGNEFDAFERIFLLFWRFDNSIFNLIVGNETSYSPTAPQPLPGSY